MRHTSATICYHNSRPRQFGSSAAPQHTAEGDVFGIAQCAVRCVTRGDGFFATKLRHIATYCDILRPGTMMFDYPTMQAERCHDSVLSCRSSKTQKLFELFFTAIVWGWDRWGNGRVHLLSGGEHQKCPQAFWLRDTLRYSECLEVSCFLLNWMFEVFKVQAPQALQAPQAPQASQAPLTVPSQSPPPLANSAAPPVEMVSKVRSRKKMGTFFAIVDNPCIHIYIYIYYILYMYICTYIYIYIHIICR